MSQGIPCQETKVPELSRLTSPLRVAPCQLNSSRWSKVTGGGEFMRLGVGIDGEARRLSARQQSGPDPAVQPLFHLDSPSQAKDDSASRDSSTGSRLSVVSATTP